jgi:exoribonuclease-2
MERYCCLRWLEQEGITQVEATVMRDNLVRCDHLPLVMRVPSLRDVATGDPVRIALSRIDLWELTVHGDPIAKVSAS